MRERVLRAVLANTRIGARGLVVVAAALVVTIPVGLTVETSGVNPLARPTPAAEVTGR